MVSGCCGAGWKPAGSSGRELSLSCTIPGSLLGLVPSSASVMRWHSSPSRDALEVSVCLRKKKKIKKSSNAWKILSRDYCKSCFGNVWAGRPWGITRMFCGLFEGCTLLNSLWAAGWCFPWFPPDSHTDLRQFWHHILQCDQHSATASLLQILLLLQELCCFGTLNFLWTLYKEHLATTGHPSLPGVLPHQNQGSQAQR